MLEPMTVRPELYVLAADQVAIWSLTRSPLTGDAVPADSTIEHEVRATLLRDLRQVASDVILVHGTSWRQEGPSLILTHAMVVARPTRHAFALDMSEGAAPVGAPLLDAFGPPAPHPADAYPDVIRAADVLQHVLRHLAFLIDTDARSARALGRDWARHLRPLRPELARLYTTA